MNSIVGLPLVSICLPVFNGAPYFSKALDALVTQSYPNTEIIISDNCSLDDTRDIALKYCKAFPKIRYSRHAENLGASKNWLHVFSLARGEYFMWAAYDDLWDVNFVSEIMNGMLSDPDFTTGFCQLDEFWHEPTNKLKTKFREPPPFSPMASRSENQVMYFAQPCPWMIYGIHKTAAMRSIVDSEPDLDATSYFFDYRAMFALLGIGKPYVVRKILFHSGRTKTQYSLSFKRMPLFQTLISVSRLFAKLFPTIAFSGSATLRERCQMFRYVLAIGWRTILKAHARRRRIRFASS